MATEFVTFSLPNYFADWDILSKNLTLSGRFSRPPGLSLGVVNAILGLLGATQKSVTQKAPCPPPSSFKPRRLEFFFQSGGSLSVPFVQKANAVALATSIKAQLQADLGPVTCIQLVGEKWGRIDEELRPAGTIVAPGADIRASAGSKNATFSGAYSYLTDNGTNSVQSVRQNTDSIATPATPFSVYAAPINTALGPLLPKGCGGVGNVTPRHFTVTVLSNNALNPARRLIIPVASNAATQIRAVGVAIATITQTMCLAYEGESDSRLSRLIP